MCAQLSELDDFLDVFAFQNLSGPSSLLIVNINKMNYKTLINCFDWCLPFVLFWRDHTDQAEGGEVILRRSVTGRLT